MAESTPEPRLGTPRIHIPTCDKHSELIDIFCEDCDKFVCTDCAKTDHKDHNWATVVKAASQRRRQLFKYIKTIKEENVPEIDRKIENTSVELKEIKKQGDYEMQKLRTHFNEIIARLTEIKTRREKTIGDHVIDRCEQVNNLKIQYEEHKTNLDDIVKLIEEHNSTMSDYKFINHHREMSQLVSAVDSSRKSCEFSLRYTCRDLNDGELESMIGQIFDLGDITVTESNSFQYSDVGACALSAFNENESYVISYDSDYIERINKHSDKKQRYNVDANDLYATDTGDVYFTDRKAGAIARLTPSGSVSTVVSAQPLLPLAICQSVDGGLLVTLLDSESKLYELDSYSRRLVRHMTLTGDVIHEYEYQEDGQTRLFTLPLRVKQNGNSDICVVNRTSDTTGHVVILSSSGRLRSVYHRDNLNKDFCPNDVECDSRCNILVTDPDNHLIHLLSPDGQFLKFLLTEKEVHFPTLLSLYGSTLWVGNVQGTVKLFQYKH
jgi:hypothetical protein